MKHSRLRQRAPIAFLVITLLGITSACACYGPDIPIVDPPRIPSPCDRQAPPPVDPVALVAERTMALARAYEPATTAMVKDLAAQAGGEVVGLEHRLKTPTSTESKIRRLMAKEPGKAASEIVLYDALRYTILVSDEPAGHHGDTVHDILVAFESRGDRAVRVKNYWPRGDSYSGTNTVLRSPEGLHWEVQFHTSASWATKRKTHDDYDRMRDSATPEDEQRRLFEAMAALWEDIPIPEGILEEGSLHALEVLVTIPAP